MRESTGKLRPFGKDGKPVDLVLYKFDACPFCGNVMDVIDRLGVAVRYRDTRTEPGAREELTRIGGKPQVPCLFIDGRPMYESADIMRYLENEVELR
jgi:glutaredoxin 3